jgi:hypothetical protein
MESSIAPRRSARLATKALSLPTSAPVQVIVTITRGEDARIVTTGLESVPLSPVPLSPVPLRRSKRLAAKQVEAAATVTPIATNPEPVAAKPTLPSRPPALRSILPLTTEESTAFHRQVDIMREYLDMCSPNTSNATRIWSTAHLFKKCATHCTLALMRTPKLRATILDRIHHFKMMNAKHGFDTRHPYEWSTLRDAMNLMHTTLETIRKDPRYIVA